ncbi:MAG: transporter [Microbacterium sp.]|jgi:EmrB/QacA subfamily drug resistance transporter|nr:transporter [Microbacterium sp.]
MSVPHPPSRALRGNPTATLVAVSFGLFMVGLDATVVSIANPAIAADLHTSFTELQWITNVYLLGLAVFLILGGKIGDRFGRRRMYIVGVAAFAVTSIAIGLVGSVGGVIVFRALQGASAALLMPQTLSLLRSTFPREKFGMAVGIWGGVSSVAIAAGPIVGGALVATLGWESIFYINAPIAAIGIVFAALALTESTIERPEGRFDVLGVVLLALGLAGLVVGIVQGEAWGWGSLLTVGSFALGVVFLAAFVVVEARVRNPLLPLSLFRSPRFTIGGLAIGTNFFTLLGVTFFLTLYLMNLRGIDGLAAGVMLLPLSGVSIIASPLGAIVVSRIGARWTMIIGLLAIAASFLALTTTTVDSPYVAMAAAFVVLSFGVGFTMTAGADSIVGSAPVQHAGVAGGFQATMLQLGGALGTAVFSAVVAATVAGAGGTLDLSESERGSLAQGIVPDGLSAVDTGLAQAAFLDGFHGALLTGAVVAVIVAALAAVFIRDQRRPAAEAVREETVEGLAGHV